MAVLSTARPGLHKTAVIDVVALTENLISRENTPFLYAWLRGGERGGCSFPGGALASPPEHLEDVPPAWVSVSPAFPAVTCSAQTTYLTGRAPGIHGIVGNNLWDAERGEFRNWHQAAALVRSPRLFQRVKEADPRATTFSSFWWFPMGDRWLDFALTPRPQYLADGGKAADLWTKPERLRAELQAPRSRGGLGTFPLHRFWGPGASIESTKWIVDATIAVDTAHNPTFSTVYLPHLDYNLQKHVPLPGADESGGVVAADLRAVDDEVARLVRHYQARYGGAARIVVLSEYGIQPVQRPVHINRALRAAGLLATRRSNGGRMLDTYASAAFAIPDHQVAHVYVNDQSQQAQTEPPHALAPPGAPHLSEAKSAQVRAIQALLRDVPGVAAVLRRDLGEVDAYLCRPASVTARFGPAVDAERTGDLVVVAEHDTWFTYYYWPDENDSESGISGEGGPPDFAHCVAIHAKPGYDPVEMFYACRNQTLGLLYLLWKVFLVYVLRLRLTVDGTRFDADRVRGSHGATRGLDRAYWPILASSHPKLLHGGIPVDVALDVGREGSIAEKPKPMVYAEDVYDVLWRHLVQAV